MHPGNKTHPAFPLSRRRFVQGLAAGGTLAALGWDGLRASGETAQHTPQTLSGTHFKLTIDELPVNYTGKRSMATAVNGSVPGPTLRWKEGDSITIAVTNHLKEPTSIHWHAIRLPSNMDGVPGLSFSGIAPGETFHYRFPVVQNGTAWYHGHSRFQEQIGLVGAIVIEPRHKDPVRFDREYVIFLSDWTDTDPEVLFNNLKEQSDYYNNHRLTLPNFLSEAKQRGLRRTLADRLMWARMNMSPTDLLDVTGATYTYLLNGNNPAANWTGVFQPGERVRLRFINGSAMTYFDVRIPGLPMTVVQADGNDVEPVTVDEFRIAVAETYDVIVEPREQIAYTIFAQSMDRSGYARGTLAPRMGMAAAIPPMDPVPMRSMQAMGMSHMPGMGMATRNMAGIDNMTEKDASAPNENAKGNKAHNAAGMKMDSHPVDHEAAGKSFAMGGAAGTETGNSDGTIPFPQPGPGTMPIVSLPLTEIRKHEAALKPANPVKLRTGPQIDNVAMHATEQLNDPGIGLENNGRRVLTYADLRALYRGVDGRPPTREFELHLTGNMKRFIWGFNGEKFSNSNPLTMKLGERIRIVLVNDTMMEHPIHLHGLWSELENGQGAFRPYKHTINVKPAERVSYLVSADTPGYWAFHCHLLYHMEAGMFRTVVVS